MHDLNLNWKDGRSSVYGIDNVELPQFSLIEYRTVRRIESLSSGKCITILYLLQISERFKFVVQCI